MKKVRLLSVLMAILMMATLALAEGADDPVVVKAGDVELRLSEAQETFDMYYNQYAELYAQNGLVFTSDDVSYLLEAIVEMLGQQAVLDGKVAEYGLGEITDADREALRAEVKEYYEGQMTAYAASVGLSYEEAVEDVTSQGITEESIYDAWLKDLPYERLFNQVIADVTVTDEDIATEYDAYVAEDKATYENDVASWELYSVYYGTQDIYYMPEGYRYIKHILLATPDDVAAELVDYETDMSAVQTEINALDTEMEAAQNAAEDADPKPRAVEDIQADLDTQQAKYDELLAKYEEAREQILPSLRPIIDEINEKLAAGESFDALIEEYNTDPGMGSTPEGYEVHKDSIMWDTLFRDTAMALENVGDVSEPVLTDFGVHIIRYEGDAAGGGLPLSDTLAASLRESLLSYKQEEAYYAAFETWLGEVEIESHPELIVLPELPSAEEVADTDEAAEPEATAEAK